MRVLFGLPVAALGVGLAACGGRTGLTFLEADASLDSGLTPGKSVVLYADAALLSGVEYCPSAPAMAEEVNCGDPPLAYSPTIAAPEGPDGRAHLFWPGCYARECFAGARAAETCVTCTCGQADGVAAWACMFCKPPCD